MALCHSRRQRCRCGRWLDRQLGSRWLAAQAEQGTDIAVIRTSRGLGEPKIPTRGLRVLWSYVGALYILGVYAAVDPNARVVVDSNVALLFRGDCSWHVGLRLGWFNGGTLRQSSRGSRLFVCVSRLLPAVALVLRQPGLVADAVSDDMGYSSGW